MIRFIQCHEYNLPFAAPVRFGEALSAGRTGLLLETFNEDGNSAWGEVAPLPGFSRESVGAASAQAETIARTLVGRPASPDNMPSPTLARFPSVHFAYRSLLENCVPATDRGHQAVSNPELCALITGSPEEARSRIRVVLDAGFRVFKIKVGGQALEADIALVREARNASSGSCRIRLDANRAWTREQFLKFCDAVGPEGIEFLEEPLCPPETEDYEALYEQTGFPCAVDETLQTLSFLAYATDEHQDASALNICRSQAATAQYLIWKPSLSMHPRDLLGDTTAPIVLSGAYESGVGTGAIIDSALRSANKHAIGVDTYSRLSADILNTPLTLNSPRIDHTAIRRASAHVDKTRLTRLWRVE